MDSHLGRALWRFSVDALASLLTYDEGSRLPPQPDVRKPKRRRSPRAPDALGVLRRNTLPTTNAKPMRSKKQRSPPPPPPQTRIRNTYQPPQQAQRERRTPLVPRRPLRDICARRAVRFDPLPVVIEG